MIFGECTGSRSEDGKGLMVRMGASSVASRWDWCGVWSLSGLMIAGSWLGTLCHVVRRCVLGLVLRAFGSVGLVLVVTGGCLTTL